MERAATSGRTQAGLSRVAAGGFALPAWRPWTDTFDAFRAIICCPSFSLPLRHPADYLGDAQRNQRAGLKQDGTGTTGVGWRREKGESGSTVADSRQVLACQHTADGTNKAWIPGVSCKAEHFQSPRFPSRMAILCSNTRPELDMDVERMQTISLSLSSRSDDTNEAQLEDWLCNKSQNQTIKRPGGRDLALALGT